MKKKNNKNDSMFETDLNSVYFIRQLCDKTSNKIPALFCLIDIF